MTAFRLATCMLLMVICSTGLEAQQFGGNPPSLHWQQINTDTARIIFPAGLLTQAQQVAAIVHQLSRSTLPTIGGHQHKIDIVFQNQTIIPNGYVGLAPFRSEFQLTPEQNSLDLGSLPWQKMLAIHEYRHVQQYNNYRIGLSKAFYYLFGEGGQALANSLAIPNWFWEGDAVYQETLVSDQGRGRLPFFFNSYRSLWAGGKDYSWMKLRNGSLRDYVPDWYPMGYMLVAYGREKYGDEFWKKVTLDAAAFRGLFYPLQTAITRYAGISFTQFRQDALDFFRARSSALQKDSAAISTTPPAPTDEYARAHRHFVADQQFPQFMGKDSLVYMKSSYRRNPAFMIRDGRPGREKKLKARSISLDYYFSYGGGKIVYAAYETDPRWGWRDYSVLRVLDPATGKDQRITSRSRYFAPDISPDGQHIVAVQESPEGACDLHLLNSATGQLEKVIPNRDSLFYTYPKFFNGRIVSAVRNPKGEMSLALTDPADGTNSFLLPFSFQTIAFPSIKGDTIWFTASRNGEDRVFGLAGGQLFRLTLPFGNPATGQYGFQAGARQYAWTTFTAVGYKLDTGSRATGRLEPMPLGEWARSLPIQGIDSLDEGPAHLLDGIGLGNYPTKKYPLSFHLLNFHSWRPYINDPDYTFSLTSENILNTLESELYVTYNRNEQYKQVGADAVYGAWFPWIDAGWDYTFDRNALYGNQKVFWNETEGRLGFSIPLHFTRHLSYTNLQFGSDLVYNKRYYQGIFKDTFNSRAFAYIDPYVTFTNQVQQAPMQIYPRFAQVLTLSYNRAVTSLDANQFLASGSLYLPGLAGTHSLVLSGAFQQRDSLHNARFSNSFPFSRGYTAENFYQLWKLSANYNFPLLYPDWGIGNVVYFQRIRANAFYDYTNALDFYTNGNKYKATFRSYGTEIFFDTKWWNQLPVSFGIRYSHLIDRDFEGRAPNQWEFILPLNLLGK
ncbi:MAG TPA: hypothetical protein VL832_20310 [Puia sp.]|nr:hypothetical protein [Puia sp.]